MLQGVFGVLSIHAVAVSVVNVIHLVIFTVFASNMLYTRVPEILKTILSLLREIFLMQMLWFKHENWSRHVVVHSRARL